VKPLAGLRVIDLSRLLPGPYATLVLADLGAEVIKVEDPTGGDYIRWFPPLIGDTSALFGALNRGKKSVRLDLRDEADRDTLLKLIDSADILVESFRPGVLERLGLGRKLLAERNPRLIGCSITGYGRSESPWRDRAGHDLNYIGLAGLLGISGQDPDRPAFPGGQVADIGGGSLMAVIGILAALQGRAATGRGTWVDTSMTHGVLAFLTMHLAAHRAAGTATPPGPGSMQLNGVHCCYNVYRCRDGHWLTLGALEPKFWMTFCTAIDRPDLVGSGFDPARPGEPAYDAVVGEFAARTRAEWEALAAVHDFCCEPVLDFNEIAAHPLLADMQFAIADGPLRWPQVEVPIGLPDLSGRDATPPPSLGQHDDEILGPLRKP
jgi:crotonobetainyl-CoA:carnitine CoA-transferase CaiB-like acyl-CoA transferase